jgi:hypothetical protein
MNQVITEGLQLMPPAFAEGLAQWSREDGRPNQDTYATAANAALVALDAEGWARLNSPQLAVACTWHCAIDRAL